MSARRFTALVLLGVALIQAAWIIVLPAFAGMDEFDHAFRAASVARGQWEAGPDAASGRGQLVTVPADFAAAVSAECTSMDYTGTDNCFGRPTDSPGSVQVATAAAAYNPVFYWVIGTMARPFHGADALYAMRVATALISLALVGAGVWCLARRRSRRRYVLPVMLALSPMVYYSMGVAAPNGPEMAAGFALWCALIGLLLRDDATTSRACLVTAGAAAVVLVNLRELGPGFVVITLALMTFAAPARVRRVVRSCPWLTSSIAVAVVIAGVQAIWWSQTHTGTAGTDTKVPWAWSHPFVWQFQMVGAFPYRNHPAPVWIYPFYLVVLGGYLFLGLRRAPARLRLILLTLVAGVFVMPFVLTAMTYSSVGVIWQGRYALPLAVGIPLLAGEALTGDWPARAGRVVFAAGASVLVAGLGCLFGVRAVEIAHTRAHAGLDWHAPNVALIVALCVGAAAAFARAAGFRISAWEAADDGAGTTTMTQLDEAVRSS